AGITSVNETTGSGDGQLSSPPQSRGTRGKAEEYLGHGDGQETAAVWAAVAQVHATLALAAPHAADSGEATPRLPPPLHTAEFSTPEVSEKEASWDEKRRDR